MIQNSLNRYSSTYGIILLFLISGFFAISLPLHAQATLGARSIALGQAATALPNSEWAVFENPAMLDEQRPAVSFFAIRYYGLAELTDLAAVVSSPVGFGVIGAGAHRYGDDLYNESRIRLVYKNSFQNFHYGAAVTYNHVVQGGGYGSVGAVGIDVGVAARIISTLWIGAKATNINQPKYGQINDIDENLPRNLSIGFSYRLSDVALLTTDVIKDVNFPLSYRGGVEVRVVDRLFARAGITTSPQTFSGGFGYNTEAWGVNLVVQRHEEQALGYSPGLDFNISW